MSSKQKTSINMSHLYSSNRAFANRFMSFLWEAKKAPRRAPACRGNPALSRTAPFGEPRAWPHVCWEMGGNSPCSTCMGGGHSWGWGKCHPSTPDPSGSVSTDPPPRVPGQGRWSQKRSARRMTSLHTQNVQGQLTEHHRQKFCWVMEQKLNSPCDHDTAWNLLWDK